jgi:hypothetical protein
MTFSNINTSTPNSGLGDKLRDAFNIVNYNFSQIEDQVSLTQLNTILGSYSTITYTNSKDTILQNQINGLSTSYSILSGSVSSLQTQVTSLGLLVDSKASLTQLNNSVASINSTIAALEIEINTKITEAPVDGLIYGRQDENWVEVTGGGSNIDKVVGTLFQRGTDALEQIEEGTLEIGRTYWIKYLEPGDDFSNCGDNQNTEDRRFIATATTPTNWTNGSAIQWQQGAPVINILENSLKQPFYFEYLSIGQYWLQSYDPLFTNEKTFCLLTNMFNKGEANDSSTKIEYWNETQMKLLTKGVNDVLNGHCIEIRVYN